ncbi:MAG: NAD(P)-dependent oxidoreductase [Candidatus Thorarchaeota archaeon]|nr:NAD(P)-dependent oxidoreductase [Candidatus Thorarchaeota archaeon]
MKERVLLLGASGSMGAEAFQVLWKRRLSQGRIRYEIVLLQRPSERNKELFAPYERGCGIKPVPKEGVVESGGLKIVWGDATNYCDMLEAVRDADWVLCPMALIAPAADHNPSMSEAVNTVAIKHVIKAIYELGSENHTKFVYVGSVAETGDRLQSIHMGRVGDPLKPSVFDFYATCKIAGERAVIESGLKYWVSLRQTYIAIPNAMDLMDPIMFHQPIDTCIELNTARDAGRGLVNCLDIPEESDFWRRVYNMGGGPECRAVFLEMIDRMMQLFGLGDYRRIMERKWFATRNFHCQFYEDSWILNEYLRNFGDSLEDYYRQVKENLPISARVAAILVKIPGIRNLVLSAAYRRMKAMVCGKDGTLRWYESHNEQRIKAFYGSFEEYESIGDWDDSDMPNLKPEWKRLEHGYDESKSSIALSDLQGAAEFRGGRLLSTKWNGDMYLPLEWECAFQHHFTGTPYLVLKTGHWCPDCAPPPWDYGRIAEKNPFFAQVWYTNHSKNEKDLYDSDCYKDIL